MNKFNLPILFATVCLAALLACGSRSIACDAESASDVFNDPEIKALLERSKPLAENYEPPERLTHYDGRLIGPGQFERVKATPFFDFLDSVINKALADQPYEYRKAACKIILRYFLELTPSLDALYVQGSSVAGDFIIDRGSTDEREDKGAVWHFITTTKEGRIARFRFDVYHGACGGYWSDCCESCYIPKCFDEEMIDDLKTLGLSAPVWQSYYFATKPLVDTAAQ